MSVDQHHFIIVLVFHPNPDDNPLTNSGTPDIPGWGQHYYITQQVRSVCEGVEG